MNRRPKIVLAIAAVLLVIGGGIFAAALLANRPSAEIATSSPSIGGPFTLVSTDGRTVTDQTYRGKWLLVYFGYTFCPDACPMALTNMGVALDKLGPDAAKLQPVFITVDPKRDTRQALAEYMKSFDPRIAALTGSEEQTAAAAKAYRVYYSVQKTGGDDYLVDHSAYIYLMSPAGKFAKVLAGNLSGDQMAEQLRRLIDHSA